ncbi:MAG TPA: sulfite reductase subunit A [Gammaproteobacteria bacterium]|nr:sulfite reductase subunit A [Gammaproteobacteria bacterium]
MSERRFLARADLQALIDALIRRQGRCLGPQVRDGAIQYLPLSEAAQLPWGLGDEQAPGRYRLRRTEQGRCFAWANGPQALKPLAFAPEQPLWSSRPAADGGLDYRAAPAEAEPLAVLGVRACDLAGLALQDRHFLGDPPDPWYRARREALFLVAVDCSHPAATCFCASTGDGPACDSDFDLGLEELEDGFLVRAGSAAGEALLDGLPTREAAPAQLEAARQQHREACAAQRRALPAEDLPGRLLAALQHPRWDQVGARCLACGNCTAVCPSCFCNRHEERPEVNGASAHVRLWDSCFSAGHSLLHGHPLRAGTAQRYRQWLTHKLGSWVAQYGRSGCVGCGRCITWCPVGIDLTEEVAALLEEGDD